MLYIDADPFRGLIVAWRKQAALNDKLAQDEPPIRDQVGSWTIQARVWAECANALERALDQRAPTVTVTTTGSVNDPIVWTQPR